MKFCSDKEDVTRIARLLNNELKNKFIINYSFKDKSNTISGTYRDDNFKKSVLVVISYNKEYFLRLLVCNDDINLRKKVLNILGSVLINIVDDDLKIGEPFAYYLPEKEYLNPYIAWSFKDSEEFSKYLKNIILYDEDNLDNLYLLGNDNNKKLNKIKIV